MTEQSTPTYEPSEKLVVGDWCVVTDDVNKSFPAGTKALVTDVYGDAETTLYELTRQSKRGRGNARAIDVPAAIVTTDLSWLPMQGEMRVQTLIAEFMNVTGMRIDRTAALEILGAVDKVGTEES